MMQTEDLQAEIKAIERTLIVHHRANETSLRLATIPGINLITATAMVAMVVDATAFRSARYFGSSSSRRRKYCEKLGVIMG